jgi:hypothetical protein
MRRRRTDKFLCSCVFCRAIKVAWVIGMLGALTLATNILKEVVR